MASGDIERQATAAYFESLLSGQAPARVAAERLGLDPKVPVVVVAFDLGGNGHDLERVATLLAGYWESFRRHAVCGSVDQAVYAMVRLHPPLARDRLLAMTADVIGHAAKALGRSLCSGVGGRVDSIAAIPRSRTEADRALQVLVGAAHKRGDGPTVVAHLQLRVAT